MFSVTVSVTLTTIKKDNLADFLGGPEKGQKRGEEACFSLGNREFRSLGQGGAWVRIRQLELSHRDLSPRYNICDKEVL